jgi:hypothetical protein
MKTRFRLYRRNKGGRYYIHDETTGKQESLLTTNRPEAVRLAPRKKRSGASTGDESCKSRRSICSTAIPHFRPHLAKRHGHHHFVTKTGRNLALGLGAIKDKAFDSIRNRELIQNIVRTFFGRFSMKAVFPPMFFYDRIHNYAIGMHWLPWPVLPKLHWPAVKFKEKRAITFEEHQEIINREYNPATRAYYQLLWHLGGAQTDIATLTADDIDWKDRTIAYRRHKTAVTSLISFGEKWQQFWKNCHNPDICFRRLPESTNAIVPKFSSNGWQRLASAASRFIRIVTHGPNGRWRRVIRAVMRCKPSATAARRFIVLIQEKRR